MLYDAFDTPNRMPITRWEKTGVEVASGNTLVAELGSLSLEFTRLSQLTGEPKFFDAIQRITNAFDSQQNITRLPGMWPVNVNARELEFREDTGFTLGGMSDSVYEYLAKVRTLHQINVGITDSKKEYLLLGGLEFQYQRLYQTALIAIKQHIFFRPMTVDNRDILFTGSARAIPGLGVTLDPQVQHLGCFTGGMVAIGAKIFSDPHDLDIARKLVDGCIWAYNLMPTGIMPELFHVVPCPAANGSGGKHCTWDEDAWGQDLMSRNSFDEQSQDKELPLEERLRNKAQRLRLPKGVTAMSDKSYKLRPEAIESIFVLYRITGDERLREEAWKIFEAIVAETRTNIAFASIDDVTWKHSPKSDKMESFWMAETLKYFYLLYSEPDFVSLDDFVFNTEAHPFKRPR
jgi:mannosyl-oligosaccharide alpha-1,2-mannosidase